MSRLLALPRSLCAGYSYCEEKDFLIHTIHFDTDSLVTNVCIKKHLFVNDKYATEVKVGIKWNSILENASAKLQNTTIILPHLQHSLS